MRALDPQHVALLNTTAWYLDRGYVRAVQPTTDRDVVLPPKYGVLWLLLQRELTVGELCREAGNGEVPLEPAEVCEMLCQFRDLNLVKIAHPCWVEPEGEPMS
jgi:hypothetical protein